MTITVPFIRDRKRYCERRVFSEDKTQSTLDAMGYNSDNACRTFQKISFNRLLNELQN